MLTARAVQTLVDQHHAHVIWSQTHKTVLDHSLRSKLTIKESMDNAKLCADRAVKDMS